jgi:UDP-N-acetylmuramoyl-tripeptide--D-alanyl-D-alanine ligase
MKSLSMSWLVKILAVRTPPCTDPDTVVHRISTDSRDIRSGDCFVALAGQRFDGHRFVNDALAQGAVCAVVSQEIDLPMSLRHIPLLYVQDTTRALGEMARAYRLQAGFNVIGITGSVGKTTTRHMIAHVLSQYVSVYQAPQNFNNLIGLPLTLLGAPHDTEVVVTELGTNCPGEIARLSHIAQPNIALVTNVYPAHLAGFGTLEAIRREKLSICTGLAGQGTMILNADQPELLKESPSDAYTYGLSAEADVRATRISTQGQYASFWLDDTYIEIPLSGLGNIYNALAAYAVCRRLGITRPSFAQAIRTLSAVSMRAQIESLGTLTLINDCYNANPASMKNALDIMAGWDTERRRVFVCGDMAELGDHTEQFHKELGHYIAKSRVDEILAVGPWSTVAAQTAREQAGYLLHITCVKDVDSACQCLADIVKKDDIILVKGSRAAQLEAVSEQLHRLFGRYRPAHPIHEIKKSRRASETPAVES